MIDINNILLRIQLENLVDGLRLTSGNCGIFAYALKELLGYGQCLDIGCGAHFVLKVNDDLYIDGSGKMTKRDLDKKWGRWGTREAKINNDLKDILFETHEYHTLEEMKTILLSLSENLDIKKWLR